MTGAAATGPPSPRRGDPSGRLTVGERVVVRYLLPPGSEAGATDVLGMLRSRDEQSLVVDSAFGPVTIPRRAVVAAKDVPPPPSRPGPAHRRVGVDDLELLMARGWVAVDQAGLGSWLLRSASSFTSRANSALPVGDPSLPLDRAVDYVERWYGERGRRPMFQLPGPAGFEPADTEVGAQLLERGYAVPAAHAGRHVHVMTAPLGALPPLTAASPPVTADARLQSDWLIAYGESRHVVPGVTESVLTGSRGQLFMSVRDDTGGRLVGIARMAIHPGWAGIFGLWVRPEHRRRGVATAIVSAIGMAARDNNMPSLYAQVSGADAGAVAFWQEFDFTTHHDYLYLAAAEG
ncbi:GNAT family N-acetyltransferase [Intrasporangium sp.]|uniref:GNAT family N-acetyltransferase n=1 Tax=Intrasporangium sp. TaxID=1925024 RepID=UPI003221C464